MDATMNVKELYGFAGLGQMGGNIAKSIHVKEYSVMAANTAQSDLAGLDIPEDCKYHILGGYGSSKERKRQSNCWQKIIARILIYSSMKLRKDSKTVGLFFL